MNIPASEKARLILLSLVIAIALSFVAKRAKAGEHFGPHPMTGLMGKHCNHAPMYLCLSDLPPEWCEAVQHSIAVINAAAGFELAVYGGVVESSSKALLDRAGMDGAVPVGLESLRLPPGLPAGLNILGLTWFQADPITLCNQTTAVSFYPILKEFPLCDQQLTVFHEILHSLGVPHHVNQTSSTLMRSPHQKCTGAFVWQLPEHDLNTLKSLYNF